MARRRNACHRLKFRGLVRGSSSPRIGILTAWVLAAAVMNPTRADGQLDQPLPPPPEREKPAPKLTKAPTVKKAVDPVYPTEALDAGVTGDVTLTIDIDAEGRV